MSTAFNISSQRTEIKTFVFHATSLEAAAKLMLSTEPQHVRKLEAEEVSAVHGLIYTLYNKGRITAPVEVAAIRSAIYIGRTRENRRIGEPFSDEPLLYLIFPHLRVNDAVFVERLLKLVIVPAFTRALCDYDVPQVPGGVQAALPPVADTRKDAGKGIGKPYEVRAYLNEDWSTAETMPWSKSATASRQQLHRLAWKCMQEITQGSQHPQIRELRDMIFVILVPKVNHTEIADITSQSGGGDTYALRRSLSLYAQDLKPEFLGEGKALYSGKYDMMPSEDQTRSGPRTHSPKTSLWSTHSSHTLDCV